MPFPPNLYLIGAQKSGTTLLATMLGQHPDICLAEPKEPHFFAQNWGKGLEWYQGHFARTDARYCLDASPSYTAAPLNGEQPDSPLAGIPQRLFELQPEARFVYMMRDPVKRTYSSYWHSVRAGDEQRSFAEAIRDSDYYLRMGRYHKQLALYLQYFPLSRFKLIFFEDFVSRPEAVANQCFDWLELPQMPDFATSRGRNESFTYGRTLSWLDRSLRAFGGVKRVAKALEQVLPYALLKRIKSAATKRIPAMDEEEKRFLVEYFSKDNALLEGELGLVLPPWLGHRDVQ